MNCGIKHTKVKQNTRKKRSRKMQGKEINRTKKILQKPSKGITLIALVVTIVLNCSYLAMVEANPI